MGQIVLFIIRCSVRLFLLFEGTAYVIGGSFKKGEVKHTCSSIVRAVNVATGECARVADTLEPTYQPALSAIGNRIVACGGYVGFTMTRICQIFNPKGNT